ncbi:S1 family peptidase [Alteromonas lipolytica]|uniref:Serine protease n=1 Tax=Alteromonas lipolytica TaxID=1856405 RepID=A0A1E8FGX9_9ALTE|nr:serine protease [Alteromonas lipolytica]OFI35195.1 hypothetical protein BFC17_16780 [Alteromonas lipolytica]GGF57535.1 hypothetical protein GCM10011338_07210 [Alteromonas lipolytica]
MKIKNIFLLLILICSQAKASASVESLVKIQSGDMSTNGNGVILGHDDNHVYLATAMHVIDGIDLSKVFFSFYQYTNYPNFKKLEIVGGEVVESFKGIDLSFIKVQKTSSQKSSAKLSVELGDTQLCRNREKTTILGFSGAATNTFQKVESELMTFDYYDSPEFFRITSPNIEEGMSGSPVLGNQSIWRGILLSKANSNQGQVLHVNEIIKKIDSLNIPKNNIGNHLKSGVTWNLSSIYVKAKHGRQEINVDVIKELKIKLNPNGKTTGTISATYCYTETGIRFSDVKGNGYTFNTPSSNNPAFFNPHFIFSPTILAHNYRITEPPFAFNFNTGKGSEPKLQLEDESYRLLFNKLN